MGRDLRQPVNLVVGADSMIGEALMQHLKSASESVIGTTRRRDEVGEDRIFLDLAEDLSGWICPRPLKVAYLCAGATKLEACYKDPEGTSRINVENTVTLVERFIDDGAFVIFLSSNQVFDGSKPHVEPDHLPCPVTEYGRQKAETERILSQWGETVAVVRMTKVLGQNSLLSQWSRSLRAGELIRPFEDMSLAPVPLSSVVSVLRLIGDSRRSGIWQVSGERDISYAEAASIGAVSLGADLGLVESATVASVNLNLEANPRYTTLNVDRLRSELGLLPPPVKWIIEQAFVNPKVLEGE